jgi:DNA (cytosine-5)-methyltransferase 1
MVNILKYIDLCAGTGAFSLCLKKINAECVMSNDIENNSKLIYNLNFPEHNFVLGDINNIELDIIPDFDLLCAGFPCQPFSIAGNQYGFDDERSNVFYTILKILKYKMPKIVILENVKNLKTHDKNNTYKFIEKSLLDLGYHIHMKILDTSKITNIPHHRERIYIICFLDIDIYNKFNFDFEIVQNKKIVDFLEENPDKKYYYTEKLKVYEEIKQNITKHITDNVVYQYRRYYTRENKNNCCPTLTANMGTGGHNVPLILDDGGIRKLTPRECFNLQGFNKDYNFPNISDSALYKLAGNAVSIPVIELIINKIDSIL